MAWKHANYCPVGRRGVGNSRRPGFSLQVLLWVYLAFGDVDTGRERAKTRRRKPTAAAALSGHLSGLSTRAPAVSSSFRWGSLLAVARRYYPAATAQNRPPRTGLDASPKLSSKPSENPPHRVMRRAGMHAMHGADSSGAIARLVRAAFGLQVLLLGTLIRCSGGRPEGAACDAANGPARPLRPPRENPGNERARPPALGSRIAPICSG